MLKTILLLLLPAFGVCQNKHLGTYYECQSTTNGKTQELTLYKADSFCYKVQQIMVLKGVYRVSYDSLILTTSKIPIIFRIKGNKLVAFNGHRQWPEWYLTKVR